MKAKECAEIYLNHPDREKALSDIGARFVNETVEIIQKRNLKTSTALNAVLCEQSDKWKAFCRQIGGEIKPEGYQIIMQATMPEIARYF